ncbi:MAG TPA: hypothetical protein V6D35_09580 [Candidatus Sericytochromatia bacterium]|jgi:hypothetical protein
MEQPLPPIPSQSEPENKCLGCLFMKLEGILVQPEAQNKNNLKAESSPTEHIKLLLTLQFREQRELLVDGHIKFGLKGGELRLKLKNAHVPLASSELEPSFKLSVQKKKQDKEATESPIDVEAESQPGVKADPNTNKTTGRTDPFPFISCQVAQMGSKENPVWVFGVDKDELVLRGLLKNALLTNLNVTAKPCSVEATFQVLPRDVYLTQAEGLWPKNMSKKKIVVIERAIARRFLERKLKPYLSRQILRYD